MERNETALALMIGVLAAAPREFWDEQGRMHNLKSCAETAVAAADALIEALRASESSAAEESDKRFEAALMTSLGVPAPEQQPEQRHETPTQPPESSEQS